MKKKKIDPLIAEEEFHKGGKRISRSQRKKASRLDRSKYKKTDLQKVKTIKPQNDPSLKRGRVVSILGENIHLVLNKKKYICTLRGVLKKDSSLLKNLVAVGDLVYFSEDDLSIHSIEDRYSILSRKDLLRKKEHIIAVNIDLVFIVVSVISPPLKPFLIDRYLIAAAKGKMDPVILINKIDLLEKASEEEEKYNQVIEAFTKSGYKIFGISTKTKEGIDPILEEMKNKASVFSGQSGVGKSSIINTCLGTKLKTGPIVEKTSKGAHVTTRANLIPLKKGGYCIDTPGIKSFGIWLLTKKDIKTHFKEFLDYSVFCKYHDCDHLAEPNCAVKKAVEEKKIPMLRFDAYRSLIESLEKKELNR